MTTQTAALTAEQQDKILVMVKNHIKYRARLERSAKTYPVSEKRFRALLHEQNERFRDFLKEL